MGSRIAVVGSGIAGLGAAWRLSRSHEVVLFEAADRLGGHTHTHRVVQAGREYPVDTGFIVFNRHNYPLLSSLLEELGVASQPTTMGFSVHEAASGLEYGTTGLGALFCQRRNLLSLSFLGMVRDIRRFYRESPALLEEPSDGPSLAEYLAAGRYSGTFIRAHLVPMACALWSSPPDRILEFPAKYLVRFMANHRMLQIADRPQWRVVQGGSSSYVDAMQRHWSVQVRLASPVCSVRRTDDAAWVGTEAGEERFDQVVLACHSDDALALLRDPSTEESAILGAIAYQENDTVLHTDARLLPQCRQAWSAWNAHVPAEAGAPCTVSYCMNLLQGFESPEPFVVTLNRSADIDPSRVIARMNYRHPVYTRASVSAQGRRNLVNGVRRTWFAGAYWGFGFHEDGIRSGLDVAQAIEAR